MAIPTEQQEQIALATVLDRAGILWCHVPNGEMRSKVTGAILRKMGVKAGVPDIFVLDAAPGYRGAAIELKTQDGGRVSKEQTFWMNQLSKRGWATCVARGAKEAVEFLMSLGYMI